MLKKAQRINKTRELKEVYRLGKAAHTSALVIKFVPQAKSRVAFVVSKKVSKKAVERNRIKRVLRDQMRKDLNQIKGGDYMIIVKIAAANMKNTDLRDTLNLGLSKAKLWSKKA